MEKIQIEFAQPSFGQIKMSEIIYEFIEDYLEVMETHKKRVTIICFACMAWNLALLEESERKLEVKEMAYQLGKDEKTRKEVEGILRALIKRKLKYYKSINRYIVDYKVTDDKAGSFYLNIMSTISSKEKAQDINPTSSLWARILDRLKSSFG